MSVKVEYEAPKGALMFLVMLHQTFDEVPISMNIFPELAIRSAATCKWEPPEAVLKALDMPPTSEPVCISIIAFGSGGQPIGKTIVRSYDDEPDGEITREILLDTIAPSGPAEQCV